MQTIGGFYDKDQRERMKQAGDIFTQIEKEMNEKKPIESRRGNVTRQKQ